MDRQTRFRNPHMETCRHTKNFDSKLNIKELAVDRYMHPRMTRMHKDYFVQNFHYIKNIIFDTIKNISYLERFTYIFLSIYFDKALIYYWFDPLVPSVLYIRRLAKILISI